MEGWEPIYCSSQRLPSSFPEKKGQDVYTPTGRAGAAREAGKSPAWASVLPLVHPGDLKTDLTRPHAS